MYFTGFCLYAYSVHLSPLYLVGRIYFWRSIGFKTICLARGILIIPFGIIDLIKLLALGLISYKLPFSLPGSELFLESVDASGKCLLLIGQKEVFQTASFELSLPMHLSSLPGY